MIKKVGRGLRNYFFNPRPTLFDLCVCFGVLGIGIVEKVYQGWYLEFYTIFLVVIGFSQKNKRQFNGASLTLLGLLALITLSLHSFLVSFKSITFAYLNFYLMHEGFAYIFFACLLFYIVATKATNLRLLIFTLPVVLWGWYKIMLYCGQLTPMMAVGLGVFAYLIYKKKFKWATLIALIAMNILAWNYLWVILKFECRPYVWHQLWDNIQNPPYIGSLLIRHCQGNPWNFIVGSGYNRLFVPDNMLSVEYYSGNWLCKHNDYLSIMAYAGVFTIIPIILFIKELTMSFKNRWFIAPLVAVVALSFFQITFVYPDRVAIILLSLSWMFVESKKEAA